MPLWKRSKINCSTSTTAFGDHSTSQYSSKQKTARSHRIHANGLFFVCFNRPGRHDQSAFSGDRMPGHAEACHPNGPYDGVRVGACVDHRSSRRSNGSILDDVRTDSCQTERIPVIFLTFGKNKVDSRCLLTGTGFLVPARAYLLIRVVAGSRSALSGSRHFFIENASFKGDRSTRFLSVGCGVSQRTWCLWIETHSGICLPQTIYIPQQRP